LEFVQENKKEIKIFTLKFINQHQELQ